MIERSYFIRASVAHNNNTGIYSWRSGVIVLKSWFEHSGDDIFNTAMRISHDKISKEVSLGDNLLQVEIISLNRI